MQKIPRPGKLVAAAVMTMVAAASVITFASGSSDPAPVNLAEAPSVQSTPTPQAPSRDEEPADDEDTDNGAEPSADAPQQSTGVAPRSTSAGQGSPAPSRRSTSPTATSPSPTSGRTTSPPTRPAPSTSPRPTSSPTPDEPNVVGDLLDALLGG